MKHLWVVIFLIIFNLLSIPAMKDGDGKEEPTPTATTSSTQPTEEPKELDYYFGPEEMKKIRKDIANLPPSPKLGRVPSHKSDEEVESPSSMADIPRSPFVNSVEFEEVRGRDKNKKKKKRLLSAINTKNYWPKDEDLPHIGSMTPYKFLLDTIPNDLEYFKKPEERSVRSRFRDCFPERIWTLFRHDIRYPSKETSHGMRTRLINLQESIILKFYENNQEYTSDEIDFETFLKLLADWKVVKQLSKGVVYVSNEVLNAKKTKKDKEKEAETLTLEEQSARAKKRKGAEEKIDDAKTLTPQGVKAMKETSLRFIERYGDLLTKAGKKDRLFRFTNCQRTEVSAKLFYVPIYGEPAEGEKWHAPIDTGSEGKDPLLKYDALCGHWKRNYKKSDLNVYQLESFSDGKEIREAVEGMRFILQFARKSITYSDGKMFYESCAFQMAWGETSPWCMIMITEYQARFEYFEDFEFFKNDGPDNFVNKKLGCFLFKDMVQRLIGDVRKDENGKIVYDLQLEEDNLDAAQEEPSETESTLGQTEKPESPKKERTVKKVTSYFTHLTAILKFITHMRLNIGGEDEEPLRADNYEEMRKRKWRSARIGAFATNISIVLMKCGDSYFILVLHQERPIILPDWDDELVPLDKFLEIFQESIFDCNYEEICEKYRNPLFNRSFQSLRAPSMAEKKLSSQKLIYLNQKI